MKLIFLGSGSAFTVGENNFHSNMLLEDNHQNTLLIDCGSDVRLAMNALGLSHDHIKDVYVSHLHADHAGGLEWLAFKCKFDSNKAYKPVLHISDLLVNMLWKNVLSGGLQSLENDVADLATYFVVKPVDGKGEFKWHNIIFKLVKTEHIYSGGSLVPSFGLFFTADDVKCFITTDTQFRPDIYMPCYEKADIIFHDCETLKKPSGVHSNYTQLLTLDPEVKAKMWLYHYNPGPLPNAQAEGFRGFVKRGQIFDFQDKRTLF